MRSNRVRMALSFLSLILVHGLAWAASDPPARQGLFFGGKDGAVAAPVLGTTVETRVTGIIARSKVTQIFGNPSREWVEGIYIFPLPDDAAVDTLRLKIGDRTLVGAIEEKGAARQTYEGAKLTGTKAILIEQQRPDVFTLAVANVGPGETVEVEIELQQVVRYAAGKFTLQFPMLVAPHGDAPAAARKTRLTKQVTDV